MNTVKEKELKIGMALESLMRKRGLTLKEISTSTKVPVSTLSDWKKNRNPNAQQAARVAEFLGCSIHFLLFNEEDGNEPIQQVLRNEIFTGCFEISLKRIKMPE